MGKRDITYYKKYQPKVDFIEEYAKASNAASGSKFDANSNVETKNVTTLTGEIHKGDEIGVNRLRMIQKISLMYGEDLAKEYIRQLEDHEIYRHDETHACFPYTYSSKEVVVAKTSSGVRLISFEDLYDMCDEDEILADEEKEVWCKYPTKGSIEILDKNGFVGVSRLVRKKRHRDLVRVKTAFGEDIIVTDNHPMIVEDDFEKTVPAINSNGMMQYRPTLNIPFGGKEWEDISSNSPYCAQKYDTFFMSQTSPQATYQPVKNMWKMDREFGYVVGFFVGDGNYVTNADGLLNTLCFTQKDRNVLEKIADIVYQHTGIGSTIGYKEDKQNCWVLKIKGVDIVHFFAHTLCIKHYAQHKNLPLNIYDYTEEFALGVLDGLIDSDGTVTPDGNCQIRLSSRTAIMQTTILAHSLGMAGGNTIQHLPFGNNTEYKTNYSIFGWQLRLREKDISRLRCDKIKKIINVSPNASKYSCGWSTITNVEVVEQSSFLDDNEYIYDITTESHTFVCNGLWVHNCVSVTLYPFILDGLKTLGAPSTAPKNLDSFCGNFINLVFAVAAQFAGAVATPEYLVYLDYFIRKEYGDDYYLHANDIVEKSRRSRTIKKVITDKFEQVAYSLNEPAAARNFQSVFWNISYYDKTYFDAIFEDFVFPDGTEPKWESVSWLQKLHMKWFNAERARNYLTFPVETMNLVYDKETKEYKDEEWADFSSEMWAEGHSFFCYNSDSADSLSSCCRLKNGITENVFSYTLGAGGISTGSKAVITTNINRLVQNAVRDGADISERVREQAQKNQKYLLAFNEILKDELRDGLLPIYDAGYISLEKQYLTQGINGFAEGAEFLGIDISPNEEYFKYGEMILRPIFEENKKARTKEVMFNTEFVPAENLGVKNAKWDKKDGYVVNRDCYNSYFYRVEDDNITVIDKMIMHGDRLTRWLDGGSANHINLEEHLTKEQYRKLLDVAAKVGNSYFTYNVPNTVCNKCGHISKHYMNHCEECGSEDVDYITRVIGYAKRVSKYSEERQKEAAKRYYGKA